MPGLDVAALPGLEEGLINLSTRRSRRRATSFLGGSCLIRGVDPLPRHLNVLNEKQIVAIEPVSFAILRQPLNELGKLSLDGHRSKEASLRSIPQPVPHDVDGRSGKPSWQRMS